ncbi:hypothetical protein JXA05_04255, partial [Candidatus Peregrinibacteria bacterium]|nr:hypothetical protein [Candidatus Peregrinibacteria bacterium]
LMEEILPAGLIPLAFGENIRNISYQYRQEEKKSREGLTFQNNPVWNFDEHAIADGRFLLYAKDLPAGVYTIDYFVQAGLTGSYSHPSATFRALGQADISAETEKGKVVIR